MSKGGMCDICGSGPFSVLARHKRHKHPEWQPDHGTLTRFTADKCRCPECRSAFLQWTANREAARASGEAACPDCGFRSTSQGVVRHRNKDHGPVHGTLSAYTGIGCRCEECRSARAKWAREERARLGKVRAGSSSCEICGEGGFANVRSHLRLRHAVDTSPAHGTESRYKYGCECSDCRSAAAAARKRYRQARQEKLAALVEPGIYCGGCGRRFASALQQRRCERSHGIRHGMRLNAAANRLRTGCYGSGGGAHYSMHVCGNDARHAMQTVLARFGHDEIMLAAKNIPGADAAVSYFALVLRAVEQRKLADRREMALLPINGEQG